MYALNYIYQTRWISSESQSVTNLKKMWKFLVTDLDLLSVNMGFDEKTRDLARNVSSKIRGQHFVVILSFISDIPHHLLSFWSLKMQQRTADWLFRSSNLLLNDALCDEEDPCEKINNYYDAHEVTFQGILLTSVTEKVPRISDICNVFLLKNF